MCAELDVVEVRVDEEEDWYVILRMTWAQHKAYVQGRFTPRYVSGRSDDVGLDDDGNAYETIDVTDQRF